MTAKPADADPTTAELWLEFLSSVISSHPVRNCLAKIVFLELLRLGGGPVSLKAAGSRLGITPGDVDSCVIDLVRSGIVVRPRTADGTRDDLDNFRLADDSDHLLAMLPLDATPLHLNGGVR